MKKKRPLLTKTHKQNRLKWAKEHRTWTIEEWKNVIWSDESAFAVVNGEGREYTWTKDGDVLDDDSVTPTKKFGGGKVMVWSCMTFEGIGFSCKIDDIMDAELYCKILKGELMRSIRYYKLDDSEIIFQQDGDPKHTSRLATETLDELGLEVMNWPSQSPDLNPIEHLWKHMKCNLKEKKQIFGSKEELWEALQKELEAENKELCRKLISSMSSRVQAVIQAKGGYTKY